MVIIGFFRPKSSKKNLETAYFFSTRQGLSIGAKITVSGLEIFFFKKGGLYLNKFGIFQPDTTIYTLIDFFAR
jgi:hypothetical protein